MRGVSSDSRTHNIFYSIYSNRMKKFYFLVSFALLPCSASAQEAAPAQVPPASVPSQESGPAQANPTPNEASTQPDGTALPAERPPVRRMKTIENREFDDREKIVLLLNAHCDFPSKEDLIATSPDAEKHLQDILKDETVLFSVRMRSLEALAYFDTPQNIQTMEWMLNNPDKIKHPLMLMQAIRAYPKVAPQQAPATLEKFLKSDNDMIRFITISALKNCPGDAAVDVLNKRYAVEKNRYFQTRLMDAISNHCKQTTYCNSSF